jgi:hypothetical protein
MTDFLLFLDMVISAAILYGFAVVVDRWIVDGDFDEDERGSQ